MGRRMDSPLTLKPGGPNPLAAARGELLELVAVFRPGRGARVEFNLRGVPIAYDAGKQELRVDRHTVALPPRDGVVDLRVLVDVDQNERVHQTLEAQLLLAVQRHNHRGDPPHLGRQPPDTSPTPWWSWSGARARWRT